MFQLPQLRGLAHGNQAVVRLDALVGGGVEAHGVAAIPKASRHESQEANWDALSVKLDDDDRSKIAGLPKDKRFVAPGFSPAWD